MTYCYKGKRKLWVKYRSDKELADNLDLMFRGYLSTGWKNALVEFLPEVTEDIGKNPILGAIKHLDSKFACIDRKHLRLSSKEYTVEDMFNKFKDLVQENLRQDVKQA